MWDISPHVGILEAGSNGSVFIRGELDDTLNGIIQSEFQVKSLRSGQASSASLNTAFYYCTEVSASGRRGWRRTMQSLHSIDLG